MAGDNRLVTENFLYYNFTPRSGITPGGNNTLSMSCDQIIERYDALVNGITTTGNRLPSENQIHTRPFLNECGFPVYPNESTGIIQVISNVGRDGESPLTERGICYNTTGSPNISGPKTIGTNTIGEQIITITGLTPGYYYFTAYAKNLAGITYYSYSLYSIYVY